MRTRSLIVLSAAVALMMVWSIPATADSPWEEVEIQPGDNLWCEFQPGVITVYEVDESTLPQYDRILAIPNELPDGTATSTFLFRRSGVQFLKLDPDALGPDVVVEWNRANLRAMFASAGGDLLSVKGTGHIVVRTPDGTLVDVNHTKWDGFDASGVPIVISQTGVCNA